jgi:hypothetical protein
MDATSPKLAIAIAVFVTVIFVVALLRRPLIRAVLFTSEIIVLLLIILITISGGVAGRFYGFVLPIDLDRMPNPEIVLPILGAVAGFILSAVLASFILTLTQIERNTKHMASQLDRIADRTLL